MFSKRENKYSHPISNSSSTFTNFFFFYYLYGYCQFNAVFLYHFVSLSYAIYAVQPYFRVLGKLASYQIWMDKNFSLKLFIGPVNRA